MYKKKTSERLKQIMAEKGLKQIDILNKCKPLCKKWGIKEFGSNTLSQYVTGKVEPSQKALSVLAEALGVNEVWLMGYDVGFDKTKTITLNSFDSIMFENNFLDFEKETEIPIDLFILYLSLLYTQSRVIKSTINLINYILLLSIPDNEKIKEIKKEIENILEDISDEETIRSIKNTIEMTKEIKDENIKYFLLSNQRKKIYKEECDSGKITEEDYKNILSKIEKQDSESIAEINSKIIVLDDELNKKATTNHINH